MYRDFGEPGPSSGAGSAYGRPAQPPQAQAPTAQQQVRLAGPPGRGTWIWTTLGMLGLVRFALGLGLGTRAVSASDGRDPGSCAFCAVQEPVFPVAEGTRARSGRNEDLRIPF